MVNGRARTLTSLLMNAPTTMSPRDRTKVTVLVKISTLVLLQQQQNGSLFRVSTNLSRLAWAVRLVMLPSYSLKRLEAFCLDDLWRPIAAAWRLPCGAPTGGNRSRGRAQVRCAVTRLLTPLHVPSFCPLGVPRYI